MILVAPTPLAYSALTRSFSTRSRFPTLTKQDQGLVPILPSHTILPRRGARLWHLAEYHLFCFDHFQRDGAVLNGRLCISELVFSGCRADHRVLKHLHGSRNLFQDSSIIGPISPSRAIASGHLDVFTVPPVGLLQLCKFLSPSSTPRNLQTHKAMVTTSRKIDWRVRVHMNPH